MEFDNTELTLTKEIINRGLEKAAKSMAFFTKGEVTIQSTDVQIKPLFLLEGGLLNKSTDQELTVLTTKIQGEIDGVCYLIFSELEVNEILSVSLPASVLNDPAKREGMQDAIMLEMDNIIAASVITELSNSLKNKMYGDVPKIQRTGTSGFSEIFESAKKTYDHFLYFKSEFKTEGLNINPDFIWLLDSNYLEEVKKIIESDKFNETGKEK